jgi:hypothetical protein
MAVSRSSGEPIVLSIHATVVASRSNGKNASRSVDACKNFFTLPYSSAYTKGVTMEDRSE